MYQFNYKNTLELQFKNIIYEIMILKIFEKLRNLEDSILNEYSLNKSNTKINRSKIQLRIRSNCIKTFKIVFCGK
jgi:hypothetical protein